MERIKEYDVVIALKQIDKVPEGSKGTVLMASDDIDTCIVEFVDENYDTIDTIEAKRTDINLFWQYKGNQE